MSGYGRYVASIAAMLGGSDVDTSWQDIGGGMQMRVDPHEHDAAPVLPMDTRDIVSPKEAAQMNGNPEFILRTYFCVGPSCRVTHTHYGRAEHASVEPLYCPEHAPAGHVNRSRGPADIERERAARHTARRVR